MKYDRDINRQVAKDVANSIKDSIQEQVDCGHSRSKKAALVEVSLQLSGFKRMLHDSTRRQKALQEAARENREPLQLPSDMANLPSTTRTTVSNVPVVILNAETHSKKVVIFLYGGAYFLPPTDDHWHFLQRLIDQTDVKVVVPQYAQAPDHNHQTAYDQLFKMYETIYQQYPVSDITLMGDSAGGGLATGFCELLAKEKLPQPGNLVLISPWLDLTLQNPLIARYQDKDVVLDVEGLREVGKLWAGESDPQDYRLSPINGDLSGFKNVLLFVGTHEILLPDIMEFSRRLRDAGKRVECHIGRELFHEYPITQIPESKEAIRQIQKFCWSTNSELQ